MLEDPSYASVVRWGDEGDSFVVLEVPATCDSIPADSKLTFVTHRTRNSQNRSSLNISSTAISQVLCGSSISTISTKCGRIMKREAHLLMDQMLVHMRPLFVRERD